MWVLPKRHYMALWYCYFAIHCDSLDTKIITYLTSLNAVFKLGGKSLALHVAILRPLVRLKWIETDYHRELD